GVWVARAGGGGGLGGGDDFDGQVVVQERQVAADGGGVAFGLRVGPDGVGELAVARGDRPVGRRALVGAYGVLVALLQQVLADVGGRDVEAVRQAGLGEQQRAGRLGQHGTAEQDADGPGGAAHVHPVVRVADMALHALVLVVPLVHGVPVEARVTLEPARLVVRLRVGPDRVLRDLAARG